VALAPPEIRSRGVEPSAGAVIHAGGVMFGLGFPELLLILVIVVLIFGTSRIPELGRGLGEGIRNFRRGMKGDEEEKKP
jgi:sec-independent protein translocase protein TatA